MSRYIGPIGRARMRSSWTARLAAAKELFVVAHDGQITTMTPEAYAALAKPWGTSVFFTLGEAEACAVQRRGSRQTT